MRTYIIYIVARERKVNKFSFTLPIFNFLRRKINDSRRRFYNFPSIFYSIVPSPRTSSPHNPVPFRHRNQGKRLYPCTFLPTRQNAFRNFCICIVKMAFPFLLPYIFSSPFLTREKASSFSYFIVYHTPPSSASVSAETFPQKNKITHMHSSSRPPIRYFAVNSLQNNLSAQKTIEKSVYVQPRFFKTTD